MKQCQKRSIRTSLDPSESHCQIEQVYFWSIDGQDELRELETYSATMPLIDIAGVYIISDKRQKHLRSSVSDLSLSLSVSLSLTSTQWSQLVFVYFFHFTHNLLYLSVYLFFMTCFLTCFPLASLASCRRVCVSVCVFLCSSSSGFWLEMQSWFFTTFTFTMKTKW